MESLVPIHVDRFHDNVHESNDRFNNNNFIDNQRNKKYSKITKTKQQHCLKKVSLHRKVLKELRTRSQKATIMKMMSISKILQTTFILSLVLNFINDSKVLAAMNLPDGIENILGFVPRSSFQCERDGYFGDLDNDCRIFHLCQKQISSNGRVEWRHWTYACGNQTMFNQLTLTCAFVDEAIPCHSAKKFQYLNEVIHKPREPFLTDADVTSGFSYYNNRIMSDGARARAFEDTNLMAQLGGESSPITNNNNNNNPALLASGSLSFNDGETTASGSEDNRPSMANSIETFQPSFISNNNIRNNLQQQQRQSLFSNPNNHLENRNDNNESNDLIINHEHHFNNNNNNFMRFHNGVQDFQFQRHNSDFNRQPPTANGNNLRQTETPTTTFINAHNNLQSDTDNNNDNLFRRPFDRFQTGPRASFDVDLNQQQNQNQNQNPITTTTTTTTTTADSSTSPPLAGHSFDFSISTNHQLGPATNPDTSSIVVNNHRNNAQVNQHFNFNQITNQLEQNRPVNVIPTTTIPKLSSPQTTLTTTSTEQQAPATTATISTTNSQPELVATFGPLTVPTFNPVSAEPKEAAVVSTPQSGEQETPTTNAGRRLIFSPLQTITTTATSLPPSQTTTLIPTTIGHSTDPTTTTANETTTLTATTTTTTATTTTTTARATTSAGQPQRKRQVAVAREQTNRQQRAQEQNNKLILDGHMRGFQSVRLSSLKPKQQQQESAILMRRQASLLPSIPRQQQQGSQTTPSQAGAELQSVPLEGANPVNFWRRTFEAQLTTPKFESSLTRRRV